MCWSMIHRQSSLRKAKSSFEKFKDRSRVFTVRQELRSCFKSLSWNNLLTSRVYPANIEWSSLFPYFSSPFLSSKTLSLSFVPSHSFEIFRRFLICRLFSYEIVRLTMCLVSDVFMIICPGNDVMHLWWDLFEQRSSGFSFNISRTYFDYLLC